MTLRAPLPRRHVREIPHHIAFDDVALQAEVLQQLVGLGLIRPNHVAAVGIVLEPDGIARGPGVREAERVVQPTGQAIPEPSVERRLDGMVGVGANPPVLIDLPEPFIRPEDVGRLSRRPRRRAGRERGVLRGRRERDAEVDPVDVDVLQQVEAMLAHVRDVCRERPWQRELHAGVPLVRRRQLRVVLEDDHRGRPLRRQPAAANALELRIPHGRRRRERRIADLREHGVAVRAVEEEARAAAQDELLCRR